MKKSIILASLASMLALVSVGTKAGPVIVYNPAKMTADQVAAFGQECSSNQPGNFFYTDALNDNVESVGQAVSNCIAKAMSGDPSVIASSVASDKDVCQSVQRDGIGGFIDEASKSEGPCTGLKSAAYSG